MAALGDILRKISTDIFLDLTNVLLEMRNQDKELRTSVMKLFIVRTKRKLSQSYAITRWLTFNGIMKCLQSITEFKDNMTAIDSRTGQKLDELYFAHAYVYSLRSRHLEINTSCEILSFGRYNSLPTAIFSCGLTSIPSVRDDTEVLRDLDIFIKAKLVVSDPLPKHVGVVATVERGVLRIERPCAFELFLTVKQLSANSPWNVLGFRILARDHVRSHSLLDAASQELTIGPLESNAVRAMHALLETSTASSEITGTLHRLIRLAHYTSLAVSLRLLFRQAMEAAGALWRGLTVVALDETPTGTQLHFHLWRSVFSKDFQLVLRIEQRKPATPRSENAPLEELDVSVVEPVSKATWSINGAMDVARFVSFGVHFLPLLDQALAVCSRERLAFVAARLDHSLSLLGSVVSKRFRVDFCGTHVSLQRRSTGLDETLALQLTVDVRSGKLVLDSSLGLGALAVEFRREFELFVAEINNVQAEQLFARHIVSLARGQQSHEDNPSTTFPVVPSEAAVSARSEESVPITTLDAVLLLLELGWRHGQVAEHLYLSAVLSSTALGGSSFGAGPHLAYSLASWVSATELIGRFQSTCDSLFRGSDLRTAALAESGGGRKRGLDESADHEAASIAQTLQKLIGLYLILSADASSGDIVVAAVFRRPSAGDKKFESVALSSLLGDCADVSGLLTQSASQAVLWAAQFVQPVIAIDSNKRSKGSSCVHFVRHSTDSAAVVEWAKGVATVSFLRAETAALDDLAQKYLESSDLPCVTSSAAHFSSCRVELMRFKDDVAPLIQSVALLPLSPPLSHKMRCEVFLQELLQCTLASALKEWSFDALARWAAELRGVVDLLAHCAADRAASDTLPYMLRPMHISTDDKTLSALLAVHRRVSHNVAGEVTELSGYVEVRVEHSLDAEEGDAVKLTVTDLATSVSAVSKQNVGSIVEHLRQIAIEICNKCAL